LKKTVLIFFTTIFLLGIACFIWWEFFLEEKHIVTDGIFRGLSIGSNKVDSLKNIKSLGVLNVHPIPAIKFQITYSNLNQIDQIQNAEGIRIMNYRGFTVDLFFKNKRIILVRRSVPATQNKWFEKGQTIDNVINKLRQVLDDQRDLIVIPIVYWEGDGWVALTDPLDKPLNSLNQYDGWEFRIDTEKPLGANLDIYFSNGRLARIEYRRIRIPLEL
jgi:hypothetical protein